MAPLAAMPPITIDQADLQRFGARWIANRERLSRSRPESSMEFGNIFDAAVGRSIAAMLGGIPILIPNGRALVAAQPDCVEVGPVRIIGGVRPQNFDVGYRPDGVRFAFDSKTLNDRESVGKNYQNMINDLATEATTVHSRFPYALVAFMVIIPGPCLVQPQSAALIGTLERLAQRKAVDDPLHFAEAISLVVWDPATGVISPTTPGPDSPLRLEKFSPTVQATYLNRYKGLPPHAEAPEDGADDGL